VTSWTTRRFLSIRLASVGSAHRAAQQRLDLSRRNAFGALFLPSLATALITLRG